jgi:SAM-dependent methyltransferase
MIRYKKFKDYDAYVEKQGGKITYKLDHIVANNNARMKGFIKQFGPLVPFLRFGKTLCLGARTGCEVRAFRSLGFKDSIGIDLHPVGDLVVQGDWHRIRFPVNDFSNVYCNALDHCFDYPRLINEIRRVLEPGGIFYFQVMLKMALSRVTEMSVEDRMASRAYDAMFWDTEEDLIKPLQDFNFTVRHRWTDGKWFHCMVQNG